MTIPSRGHPRSTSSVANQSDNASTSNSSSRAARSTSGTKPSSGVKDFMAQQRAKIKAQQEQDKLKASKRPQKVPMPFKGAPSYSWDDTLDRGEAFGHTPPSTSKIETLIKQAKSSGKLNISNRNLNEIPDAVWNMYHVDPNAITIDLSGGSDAWSDLEELNRFIAADNQLNNISERIGEEFLALRHVDLHNNRLTSLPNTFGNLKNITYVNLSINGFEAIPDQLYSLEKLKELNLAGNKIQSFGPNIAKWTSLDTLNVNDNLLTRLPQEMESLVSLRRLLANGNKLSDLPKGMLSKFGNILEDLELANNSLQKLIINGKLNLKRIDLHHNKLQVLSFGDDASLENLYELLLSRNRLNHLDNVEVTAVNLSIIDISSNVFEDIPSSILQLQNLKRLDFSNNQLKSIPAGLGAMPNLQVISWEGNPLRSAPRNMSGSMEVLKSLRDSLKAGGDSVLETNTKLRNIQLDDSAADASSIMASKKLTPTADPQNVKNKTLDLTKQQLQELSAEMVESVDFAVAHVRLDQNLLSEFPSSLSHFSSTLVTLSLHRNKLTKFELSFQLPALKELNLSNNQIQTFTSTQDNLAPLLSNLNLSCNRLKEVPARLTEYLPGLTNLSVNTNKITTIDPDSFPGIRVLDLGNNDIAQVPPLLGKVTSIKELNLDGNCFRVPRRATLIAGTESIMEFLRNRIVE
ncbi:hypothetical protein INT44_004940 [Umbelopsis vinacea]|uniref:Leucine-rich repeat-containing protein 40 n=1 Tax=Umbelopsis vinacea TaxID=44442 RepID=A0A8H7Q822_9FUNG|nr:hypothetical protein INT44_004940 [Umbelopsis vinacea]